ncbi:MAG: hypothetical protein HY923_01360 [Elusimicrobia bacterium]|nr:hypothetical protein [Elusimicrobiota bacterium]
MNLSSLRRAVSAAVSLSIISAAPGLAPYAAAQSIRSAPVSVNGSPSAFHAEGFPVIVGGAALTMPSLMPAALGLTPSLLAPSAPAPLATPSALATSIAAPSAAIAPAAAARPVVTAVAVAASAKQAVAAIANAGPVANVSPSAASGLGQKLEDILTGAPALRLSEELSAPSASEWSALEDSHQLARPAGDSIREAASAQDNGAPPAPAANKPAPRGPDGPFWPRLLSAGLALAPAVFLGLPLLSASAFLVGGLVIASSLSLAVMPFLGESSPKFLRAAPGVTIAALGLAAAGVSLSLTLGLGVAVAPALGWMGALALIGGWGLTRYGLGKTEGRYGSYGSVETLSAFFGGLAAVTGVALAASTPLGWIGSAVLWVAYPVSALLWFHLPGWVGKGMTSAVEGLWHGVKGLSRVLTSIHRDTVLLDRLQKFSERHWKSSKWNAVWLAVIWTPILLVEAAMYVASAAGGLAIGAVTAPVNFLWGASAKLWPGSKLNVYFAEAARFVFDNVQNGKVSRYNPLAAKLIPYANSPKFFVSAGGAIALRLLQAGWLVYSLIGAPLLSVGGLIVAFGRVKAYDEARHKPSRLKVTTDDSPSEKPQEPDQPEPGTPAKSPLLPKLIASTLALVPAIYFGLPILAGASLIQIPLYLALVLPLALMPFMGKAPAWAKSIAGKALFYNGLVLLLNGSAIWVGLVALLGGWGFQLWVKKTAAKEGSFDEAELGAFFAALASSAAVGAAWAGFLGGWIGWGTLALAAATSPLLIMHLPEWTFKGVWAALKHFGRSISDYADVLAAWSDDTDFRRNLGKHADFWLKKTYWNGVWLSVIWVPVGLVMAAQYAVSAILGVVSAAVRSPIAFAAGAFEEAKPKSRWAKFFSGWLNGWRSEDSKKLYDKMTGWLKPAMAASAPMSGRPTFKAALALLVHQIVTLAWLIGVLALNVTGLSFLWGALQGIRAALGR